MCRALRVLKLVRHHQTVPREAAVLREITVLLSSSQVQMAVDVKFVQDTLKGDSVTEIRMKFIRRIEDNLPAGEE